MYQKTEQFALCIVLYRYVTANLLDIVLTKVCNIMTEDQLSI